MEKVTSHLNNTKIFTDYYNPLVIYVSLLGRL